MGTTEDEYQPGDELLVTRAEIDYLLRQLNPYLSRPLDASQMVSGQQSEDFRLKFLVARALEFYKLKPGFRRAFEGSFKNMRDAIPTGRTHSESCRLYQSFGPQFTSL